LASALSFVPIGIDFTRKLLFGMNGNKKSAEPRSHPGLVCAAKAGTVRCHSDYGETETSMDVNRRDFLKRALRWGGSALLAGPLLPGSMAMGRASLFRLAVLRYDGNWNGRPTCPETILAELRRRTSVEAFPEPVRVDATDQQLFELPFLWLTGDRPMEAFPPAAIKNLRRHLRFGGTLVADDASGEQRSEFAASFKREIERVFPSRRLQPLDKGHAVYRSFYHLRRAAGRRAISDTLEGISIDERAAVLLSRNDLSGALERTGTGGWQYPMETGTDEGRTLSLRLAVNLAIYALTINYKLDQVQISYQLRHPGRYPEAAPVPSRESDQR
jgi:hypothetical protein